MLSYLFAALAAVVNALSSVLQRKANRGGEDRSLHLALIRSVLHEPVWFAGLLCVIGGFILQVAALDHGPLAAVQPLLALELPITLVLAAHVFGRRLRRLEWIAAAGMAGGLILLITSLAPGETRAGRVAPLAWAVGLAASLGLIAVLVAYGGRSHGSRRAAVLGVATGIGFGVTAALMTGMDAAFSAGVLGVLTTWQTWLMVAVGGVSMFLLQSALQAGSLVAAQPGITLADPVVAIGWGVVVFGEPVRTGPWLVAAVAGGLAMAAFALLLSRSPVFHEHHGRQPGGDQPGERKPGEQAGSAPYAGTAPGQLSARQPADPTNPG